MRRLHPLYRIFIAVILFGLGLGAAQAQDDWVRTGADGQPELQLYFFWSASCPHCLEAQPFIVSIPATRPWVAFMAAWLNLFQLLGNLAWVTLLSGLMMLQLGVLLVIAPERLNSLVVAFALLAIAIGLTLLAAKFAPAETSAGKDG